MELLATLILMCCLSSTIAVDTTDRPFPPKIMVNPPREEAYQASQGFPVTLPCEARAHPPPVYSWVKDGLPLVIDGDVLSMEADKGTLLITDPSPQHDGVYQCFAKNVLGIALSMKSKLQQAVLEPFDRTQDKYYRVEIGRRLRIPCSPPNSYPKGAVYWGQENFQPLPYDDRITQDYDGNLRIANVKQQDSNNGQPYVCHVGNDIIRSYMQGPDHYIEPYSTTAPPQYIAPTLDWRSENPTVAIAGTLKTFKCVYSGFPTPAVTWTRMGAPMPEKSSTDSSGLELKIPAVDYDDAGTYSCSATNREGMDPVTSYIMLFVESLPEWTREPENVLSAEDESAQFFCEATGSPPPQIQWTINGERVEDLPPDPRRVVTKTSISYVNLTKIDAQVLQCNASNKHGYIYANAYLSIFAEAPSWVTPPEDKVTLAEHQTVTLTCKSFGSPMPKITWKFKGDTIAVQGEPQLDPRYRVSKDGNLTIVNVLQEDSGSYECVAVNKFGQISQVGDLIVRRRTEVTHFPESQVVNMSSTITLECEATTDPDESTKLTVEWKYQGKFIDYDSDPRITKNSQDNSLKIIDVSVEDTGEYTCVASNGLDTDEATATITVQGKPDPPEYVWSECNSTTALVMWTWDDRASNNDEVTEFIIFYNTSFDAPNVFHQARTVPANTTRAHVQLSPWAYYTFHLRSHNSLGLSTQSEFTYGACRTPPDIPSSNPKGVCVDLAEPDQLIIVWQPIPPIDHNGEGFHYRINAKEVSSGTEMFNEVRDWKEGKLVIKDVPTFRKYEIFVQAANNLGTSPAQGLRKIFGHSGEGEPLDSPENFSVDEDSMNATSAMFTWNAVDESPERVQGHFRGYKINFWKTDDPDNVRSHEVILHEVDKCPTVNSINSGDRKRRQSGPESVTTLVHNLWPWSSISAGILVLNGGKEGHLSPPINFQTPEGVPDVVTEFRVQETGSHHFNLMWDEPLEPNGLLTGYIIGYQKANDVDMSIKETDPVVEDQHSMKLCGLEAETDYMVYIWATTSEGKGAGQSIAGTTKLLGETPFCNVSGDPLVPAKESNFIWLIVLICILLLILLILIIICLIVWNRRGRYMVFENEKLQGRDPNKDIEEEGFSEVANGDKPGVDKSEEASEKPPSETNEDSDMDSLAEYGDWDPGKFKEDGSFLGEYTDLAKPHKKPTTAAPIAQTSYL